MVQLTKILNIPKGFHSKFQFDLMFTFGDIGTSDLSKGILNLTMKQLSLYGTHINICE